MVSFEFGNRAKRLSFPKIMVLYSLLSISLNLCTYVSKLEIHREIPISELQGYMKDIVPAQKGQVSVSSVRVSPLNHLRVYLTLSGTYSADRQKLPFEAYATAGFSYSRKGQMLCLSNFHIQHAMLGGMTFQSDSEEAAPEQAYNIPEKAFEGFPAYSIRSATIKDRLSSSIMPSAVIRGKTLYITLRPSPYLMISSSIASFAIFILITITIALVAWSDRPAKIFIWLVGSRSSPPHYNP